MNLNSVCGTCSTFNNGLCNTVRCINASEERNKKFRKLACSIKKNCGNRDFCDLVRLFTDVVIAQERVFLNNTQGVIELECDLPSDVDPDDIELTFLTDKVDVEQRRFAFVSPCRTQVTLRLCIPVKVEFPISETRTKKIEGHFKLTVTTIVNAPIDRLEDSDIKVKIRIRDVNVLSTTERTITFTADIAVLILFVRRELVSVNGRSLSDDGRCSNRRRDCNRFIGNDLDEILRDGCSCGNVLGTGCGCNDRFNPLVAGFNDFDDDADDFRRHGHRRCGDVLGTGCGTCGDVLGTGCGTCGNVLGTGTCGNVLGTGTCGNVLGTGTCGNVLGTGCGTCGDVLGAGCGCRDRFIDPLVAGFTDFDEDDSHGRKHHRGDRDERRDFDDVRGFVSDRCDDGIVAGTSCGQCWQDKVRRCLNAKLQNELAAFSCVKRTVFTPPVAVAPVAVESFTDTSCLYCSPERVAEQNNTPYFRGAARIN